MPQASSSIQHVESKGTRRYFFFIYYFCDNNDKYGEKLGRANYQSNCSYRDQIGIYSQTAEKARLPLSLAILPTTINTISRSPYWLVSRISRNTVVASSSSRIGVVSVIAGIVAYQYIGKSAKVLLALYYSYPYRLPRIRYSCYRSYYRYSHYYSYRSYYRYSQYIYYIYIYMQVQVCTYTYACIICEVSEILYIRFA